MKKEILMLIIGILIGAIIATGVFLVLKGNDNKQMDRMDRGEPPTSMDGNMIDRGGKTRDIQSDNKVNQDNLVNTSSDS